MARRPLTRGERDVVPGFPTQSAREPGSPRRSTSLGSSASSETESSSEDEELVRIRSVNSLMRQRVRGVISFSDSDDFLEPRIFKPTAKRGLKVSARLALSGLIVVASLFSSGVTFVYPMLQWSSINIQTVQDLTVSVKEQGVELNQLVSDASDAAFRELLLALEWAVWWYVIQHPTSAVQALYSFLMMDPGWQDQSALIAKTAWTVLTNQYWGTGPAFSLQEAVPQKGDGAGHSLFVTYCNGIYSGAVVGRRNDSRLVEAPAYTVPGQGTTMSVYSGGPGSPSLVRTVNDFKPTEGPVYLEQKENYERGADPRNSTSDAWTGMFRFPMADALLIPGEDSYCGFARTLPVPACTSCAGYCGAIASHVNLKAVHAVCQNSWLAMRDRLATWVYQYPLKANESNVFLMVQHSRANPQQAGWLVAASNSDYADKCHLQPAKDVPVSIVSKAALALSLRFRGNWPAEELASKSLYMNFTLSDIDRGVWSPCPDPPLLRETGNACFAMATRRITLDDDLKWLAVVVLPWDAFANGTLSQQRVIEDRIDSRLADIDVVRTATWRWAAILVCTAVLFVVAAGCFISTLAVHSLDRLLDYLRKLAVLDFRGLPGLYRTSTLQLSPLKEVAELQLGFVNLARSVQCFARFVPETVVRSILRGDYHSTTINVRKRHVTIMFSDIKGFTSISEMLSQEDLLTLLYLYLSEMTRIVEQKGGVVSEILGDGLLVLWNTPDDLQDHAAAAISAAVAQQKALPKLNSQFASLSLPSVSIRIGLHTGEVLAGNIGSNKKMKYGCMGDPINLASRLEGLAKHYGVGTLCSQATRKCLPRNFLCRKLDLVRVKGKEEAVWVYEVVDELQSHLESHPRSRAVQQYHEALEAFHQRNFASTAQICTSLLAQEPGDLAAAQLLERARDAASGPLPATWTPVLEMTEK